MLTAGLNSAVKVSSHTSTRERVILPQDYHRNSTSQLQRTTHRNECSYGIWRHCTTACSVCQRRLLASVSACQCRLSTSVSVVCQCRLSTSAASVSVVCRRLQRLSASSVGVCSVCQRRLSESAEYVSVVCQCRLPVLSAEYALCTLQQCHE